MKKERISLTIDPELLDKARQLAKKEERSFSSMVSILIRDAMDHKEKDRRVVDIKGDQGAPKYQSVAAEAYQVIGALSDGPAFEAPEVQRALDHFSLLMVSRYKEAGSILPFHPPKSNSDGFSAGMDKIREKFQAQKSERSQLTRPATAAVLEGWKPINTAPLDNAVIVRDADDNCYKAQWNREMECWSALCGQPIVYTPFPIEWVELPEDAPEGGGLTR